MQQSLGERIRQRRMSLGLSQGELAIASGMSLNNVHKLENGRVTHPRVETVQALAQALAIPLSGLLGEPPADFREEITTPVANLMEKLGYPVNITESRILAFALAQGEKVDFAKLSKVQSILTGKAKVEVPDEETEELETPDSTPTEVGS